MSDEKIGRKREMFGEVYSELEAEQRRNFKLENRLSACFCLVFVSVMIALFVLFIGPVDGKGGGVSWPVFLLCVYVGAMTVLVAHILRFVVVCWVSFKELGKESRRLSGLPYEEE